MESGLFTGVKKQGLQLILPNYIKSVKDKLTTEKMLCEPKGAVTPYRVG